MSPPPRHCPARGASLIEAVIGAAIIGGLLVAALSGVGGLARARALAGERDTAARLAGEIIAELSVQAYQDSDAAARLFGPEPGEVTGLGRGQFDDVDDYDGLKETSITDRSGVSRAPAGWTRSVEVRWAPTYSPDQDAVAETGLKRFTVTVEHRNRTVLRLSGLRSAGRDSGVR